LIILQTVEVECGTRRAYAPTPHALDSHMFMICNLSLLPGLLALQ